MEENFTDNRGEQLHIKPIPKTGIKALYNAFKEAFHGYPIPFALGFLSLSIISKND